VILKQLNATNFRSFKDISLSLPRGLVCFYGENAAGKSTILETIQFVLTGRSFRATDNDELIQKDHKFLRASCSFEDNRKITAIKEQEKPSVHTNIDDKPQKNKHLALTNPVCLVESDNFFFTKANPEKKRQYLNKNMFYVEQNYTKIMQSFKKIHTNRNSALKSNNNDEVKVWTQQLIEIEKVITKINTEIVLLINEKLSNSTNLLEFYPKNPWLKTIHVEYLKGYNPNMTFSDVLESNLKKDLIIKRTTEGPHKRSFNINTKDLNTGGGLSRGQQKLLSIIFHLIQREIIEDHINIVPLLLIDDISSELDKENLNLMLKYLHNNTMQSLVTLIDPKPITLNKSLFHVEQNGGSSYVRKL